MGKKRGSALLATLCFAGVLSLSVSGYLAVCYRSLAVSNREINSSHCIELAEIGMDEALWSLNNGFDATWVLAAGTATKTLSDPQFPSHPPYPDPSSVPFNYDNGAKGFVVVKVENYLSATPLITTTGTMTLADNTLIRRTLQSNAQHAQLFTNAVGSIGNLTFTAGGLVDSYDSSDLLHPNYDPANPLFNAVVSGANVDIYNAGIYGFVATGGTTLQNQSSALVTGSLSGTDIDVSRISANARQPLFNVPSLSATPSFDPITGYSQLTNSVTLGAGSYQYDSINLGDGAVLTINAPVVLRITNSVRTSGTGQIVITNTGSLTLQVDENDGQGLNLQGAGIDNQTGKPKNLSVILGGSYTDADIPTSTIDVATDFYGSIYLPKDAVTIASNSTIYGALIGRSIIFTGAAPAFHYDAALLDSSSLLGISTPFVLQRLSEIQNPP